MNILVSTLGLSWPIIPELLGFLMPDNVPLYADHPDKQRMDTLRKRSGLDGVDEVWLCTTDSNQSRQEIQQLCQWRNQMIPELVIRSWLLAERADIDSNEDARAMRELIFRMALKASERASDGKLMLSLAGGRKTMSTDMQLAAQWFGADALLHILASNPVPRLQMNDLIGPLDVETAARFTPVVVGTEQRNELLDIDTDQQKPVSATGYPLEMADNGCPQRWLHPEQTLVDTLAQRQQQSTRLLGNFMHSLMAKEPQGNWRSLYRLPPARIHRLKNEKLDHQHLDWLHQLPKADLHRHLGGCLTIDNQIDVARAIWKASHVTQQKNSLALVQPLLDCTEWPWNWPDILKQQADREIRAIRTAALLLRAEREQLDYNLYTMTEPREALQTTRDFSWYERPGELSGSALLGHPAALEPYLQAVLDNAGREKLAYLELRGSPQKYRDDIDAQYQLLKQIAEIASSHRKTIQCRFIVILDRRNVGKPALQQAVQLAVKAHDTLDGFVVGVDVAGDERGDDAEALDQLAQALQPAFEACLPVTIHAGEGTPPEKIWDAAYRLHADRIGHGLTLRENAKLLERFRDRDICLEMCPTSNQEVVGIAADDYPFSDYFQHSVPIAVCTDNPAISRTTLSNEILKASQLSPAELSLWDTLAVIKSAFRHAFLPANERRKLLQEVDQAIYRMLLNHQQPEQG